MATASLVPGRRRLERCRQYIAEHSSEPLRLRELAQQCATTRFKLLRRFKKAFGVSPHAYQIGVRIDKARLLLERGDSLAGVAAETGFADQSHFSRHFTRMVGVTPAQYARRSRR